MSKAPLRLYRYCMSGHCHRVELFLSVLGLPVELVEVDLLAGAHMVPAFTVINPLAQVPVLKDDCVLLSDSNAILVYLAQKYGGKRWWPDTPEQVALLQRFLSLAAGELAFGPALARRSVRFGVDIDRPAVHALAARLLGFMETHLQGADFLVGAQSSIADIACYTYVAHATEGGIDLDAYTALQRWLGRVEDIPGFIPFAQIG